MKRGPPRRDARRRGLPGPRPTPFLRGAPLTIFSYASFEHTLDAVVVKRMAAFLNAGVRLGALRPAIDEVFALDDIAEAHRRLEQGSTAERRSSMRSSVVESEIRRQQRAPRGA